MDEIPASIIQYTDQPLSAIYHSLRASRRRLVIGLLAHRTTTEISSKDTTDTATTITVSVRQLAREIVAIEEGVVLEHATGEPYHNVYTALIQTHLPELDDVGAIKYDDDRKTVAPDRNLIALAVVAATTSPVAQMLFHSTVVNFGSGEVFSLKDSIDD